MRTSFLFLRKFFTQPLANASLRPTNDKAAKNLCASIDWKVNQKKIILELGPGIGSVTKHILEEMSDDCQYYGIEFDLDYVNILNSSYAKKNVTFIQGDVKDIRKILEDAKIDHVDIIISTLPFNVFRDSPELISFIQDSTKNGVQYRAISYGHPKMYDTYKKINRRIYSFTLWNIPPLYVLGLN